MLGADTYADDLLTLCGAHNVFGAAGDRRYPRVELSEIVSAAPDVVLLPDEPYAFGPRDAAELGRLEIPAAQAGRIHLLDGPWSPGTGRAFDRRSKPCARCSGLNTRAVSRAR